MYGNYGRYQAPIGVPTQPIQNNQFMQPINTQQMPITPSYNQSLTNQTPLLGKIVDSIDVVKAMDIPLDGSISYFPLTDGSAIITKKLQVDGTSKTIVYKPIIEEKKEDHIKTDEFVLKDDLKDLKEEIDNLKSEIRHLKEEKSTKKEGK